jgi:hypothetical protein
VQEPSLVAYREGEVRASHALPDRLSDGFAASTDHGLACLKGEVDELVMDGPTAHTVLATLLAELASSKAGKPVDVEEVGR